jgi:hypothetical protein
VPHCEEDGGGAATAVGEREDVGQVERADQGEVPLTHAAFGSPLHVGFSSLTKTSSRLVRLVDDPSWLSLPTS